MSDDDLIGWLRRVAPAHKEGTSRELAFNMEGLCLQELNAKINEAADALQSRIAEAEALRDAMEHITTLFCDLKPLGDDTEREMAVVNARAALSL